MVFLENGLILNRNKGFSSYKPRLPVDKDEASLPFIPENTHLGKGLLDSLCRVGLKGLLLIPIQTLHVVQGFINCLYHI